MKILDRYLARRFLSGWFSVNLVLAGLFSFLELARQLDDTGEGRYRVADALLYVLLTLPGRMLAMAPPSALLGSIVALGLLARNHELLALGMSGISMQRVGWSMARPAIFVLLVLLLGMQFIVPSLEQTAWTRRESALSESGTLLPRSGFWFKKDRSFVNLNDDMGNGLQAVDIYAFTVDGRLTDFIHAREARIGGNGEWELLDVRRTTISDQGSSTRKMPRLVLPDFLSREQAFVFALPPETLSLSGLFSFIATLEERGLNADRYRLALWQKSSLPVMTLAMLSLAFPLVLGSPRNTGLGWRIMVGGILGVAFFFINQILGYTSLLFHIPPVLTTLAPPLMILTGSLFLLRRVA